MFVYTNLCVSFNDDETSRDDEAVKIKMRTAGYDEGKLFIKVWLDVPVVDAADER